MRTGLSKLAFLLFFASVLVTPALSGCPDCHSRKCAFGYCVCIPKTVKCALQPLAPPATLKCLQDVLGCAQNGLQKLLPSLDTTTCKTAEYKAKAEAGGWKVYYGPRVWDSKVGVNAVLFFFPASSALAAKNLKQELDKQIDGLTAALQAAIQDAGTSAFNDVTSMFEQLFQDLLSGKPPQISIPNLSVKLQIIHVPCKNDIAGITLPSEGYTRWVFGWKLSSRIAARFPSLAGKSGRESTGTSLDTGGKKQLPVIYKTALRMKNTCSEETLIGMVWKLPNDAGRKCRNGFVEPGNWCLDAWFRFPHGHDGRIGYTTNRYFYYTAYSKSGLRWGSDVSWDLNLRRCSSPSGTDGCYAFKKVDTYADYKESWTSELTCPSKERPPAIQATAYFGNATASAPVTSISSLAGSDDTIVEGPGVAAMFTPGASPDPEKYTESPSPAVADITLQMQSNGSIPVVYTLTAQAAAEYTYYDSAGAVYGAVEPPAQGPVPEGFLSAEVPASSPSDFPEDGALPPSTTAPSPQPQAASVPPPLSAGGPSRGQNSNSAAPPPSSGTSTVPPPRSNPAAPPPVLGRASPPPNTPTLPFRAASAPAPQTQIAGRKLHMLQPEM